MGKFPSVLREMWRYPACRPSSGRILCPSIFPLSSYTPIRSTARSGSTTCKTPLLKSVFILVITAIRHTHSNITILYNALHGYCSDANNNRFKNKRFEYISTKSRKHRPVQYHSRKSSEIHAQLPYECLPLQNMTISLKIQQPSATQVTKNKQSTMYWMIQQTYKDKCIYTYTEEFISPRPLADG